VGRRKWADGGVGGLKEKVADGKGKRKRGGGGLLGWAERRGRERVFGKFSFLFLKKPFQTHISNF
jgi:hypothetical protein